MNENNNNNNLIEQMVVHLSLYEDGGLNEKIGLTQEETLLLKTVRETEKFLDMIPGGFFIYHADGNQQLIYANKATQRIFGCKDLAEFRALTGNSFNGVVHPDDLDATQESINEQISKSLEDLDYVEYRIIRKDGSVRWVEDYGHLVHSDAVGNIFYVFISDATEKISQRINEKQEKEKKLQSLIKEHDKERNIFQQEELQRLKVIEGLSISYDSILFADLDKDEMSPYRLNARTSYYFNKKLQVRKYSELMDDYVGRWVHPDDRKHVSEATNPDYIRGELSDKNNFCINFRCIENGAAKFLQLRIVNVGSIQHVSQIVLGFRTVDEEILQELKQKSILEDALKNAKLASIAKNTFLSNMSHDMRTPLNAIFGYTALAEKNVKNKKLVTEYLKKIDTASRQILKLIDNVLEMTYMESQDFRFNDAECNVCEIVQEVHRTLLTEAVRKNITFSLHINTVHNDVYADKEKLKQVLLHLADNAIKYTKNGGNVDISVNEEKRDNQTNEFSSYNFIVKDTGIGISAEALPHIFEPFERENDTTHAGIYGLGLGLTIAKQIIEAMGGRIIAESSPGKGSEFTVALDLKLSNFNPSDYGKASPTFDLNGKKILIVEDNEINLELETELLKDLGCIVDSAANGKIGVEKIKSSKPDEYYLVLMDIQMPVMDGRQAANAIRKLDNPALARIPIIALSANAFESDKKASVEAGMDAHLTKPINIPQLLKTIEQIVTNK